MFYICDTLNVLPLTAALWIGVSMWRRAIRLTAIDLCLIGIWLYGIAGPTINPTGSTMATTSLTGALMIYFTARHVFAFHKTAGRRMLAVLTVGIAMMTGAALYQFFIFTGMVDDAGFKSLYEVRFLFTPLGKPVNVWNSLMWLWGGIAIATFKEWYNMTVKIVSLIAGFMVWTGIVLSFSRGGYIAVGVCIATVLLAGLYAMASGKLCMEKSRWINRLFFSIGLVLTTIAIYDAYHNEIKQTLKMNHTVSQQWSTNGRLEAIKLTTDIMKEYPLGTGAGNYTLAKDFYMRGNCRSDSYTSYAPNIFAQVAVEGGLPGLIIYVLLLCSIVVWTVRTGKRRTLAIALPLIGFFIKEQTFPTFLTSGITQTTALLLLAYIQQDCGQAASNRKSRFMAFVPAVVCIVTTICGIALKSKEPERSRLDSRMHYEKAMQKGDTVTMRRMADDYPDIARYRWELFEAHRRNGWDKEAVRELTAAVLRHPRILETDKWKEMKRTEPELCNEVKEKAIHTIIYSLTEDAMTNARFGRAAMLLGDREVAGLHLERAVRSMPQLSRTWAYLSVDHDIWTDEDMARQYFRRYCVLEYGVFADISKCKMPEEQHDIEKVLDADYYTKCMEWYGTPMIKRKTDKQ